MSEMHSRATSASSFLPQERKHLLHHLLSCVEQLTPVFSAYRAASEQARTLAPRVVQAMRDVSLLTMKNPCEIGGGEIHPADQMEVIEAVVKLDSAAAGSVFIAATVSSHAMGAQSDEAVAEAFADSDFPIMAGSLKPSSSATPVDGAYESLGKLRPGLTDKAPLR